MISHQAQILKERNAKLRKELALKNRELEIEASLERVRSRSMAMHKSDELLEVIKVIAEQLTHLGLAFDNVSFGINDQADDFKFWVAMAGQPEPLFIHVPYIDNPAPHRVKEAQKNGTKFFADILRTEENRQWTQHFIDFSDIKLLAADVKNYILNCEGYARSTFILNNINLYVGNYRAIPYSEVDNNIFKRFSQVFEQAYTRFLDLQKAETQTREAQIEAALERVRAKTMAMHKSEQLAETAKVFFEQFHLLGKIPDRMSIGIFNEESKKVELWVTDQSGNQVNNEYFFSLDEPTSIAKIYTAWKDRKETIVVDLTGENLQNWLQFVKEKARLPIDETKIKGRRVQQAAFFSKGFLLFTTHEPVTDEIMQLLVRFSRVFDLTYTRFLDLQKAEMQAREAKIEAALERVRGKAMAMHGSEDLTATIVTFYHELELFSITPRRCGVGLLDKENRIAELSTMNSTVEGNSIELIGRMDLTVHPVLEGVYENWLVQKEYHPVLRGNEIKEYYQLVRPQIAFPDYPDDEVLFGYFFFFPEGGVYAWTDKEMVEDELKIYRRFTSVLSLTYKRYKDLKDAEANAREAVKQAALDRVRADIASMRTISDLDRITPLIWNELNVLGVPFIRCGVFIMDDSQQLIHTFLSTPDGKAIAAFHLPYHIPGNVGLVLNHWRDKKNYIDHWNEADFAGIADVLVKQGAIATAEQYLDTLPQKGFYLHFLPFLQGMLYVGNTTRLGEEEIELIQSIAGAFSTAYARYEDFNKLEAAKQQVDKTLMDLKQAQQQLVQSEKMASLGELTAGIAHEIQNPLNFVNNFSEVNKELLEELVAEADKGNMEEVKVIANDIKGNSERINHHGKRADAIVKGMLQHSHSSSATKESTDINALADEFLRLSYHGLRAKDKLFNATLKTDFDTTMEKINIIPQDIGRVVLNLLNNAFYSVNEKKKQVEQNLTGSKNLLGLERYEPVVSVSTKKIGDKVEIRVSDNGNGIPQKVLDKIFQPFFTTKPTGQGTGLGLSLSYDIIKAHGGEIKVETGEGKGAAFIIHLLSI